MTEQNTTVASALKKKWRKKEQQNRASSVQELRMLDRLCRIGCGHGVSGFTPEYFADGPKPLRPGQFQKLLTSEVGLPPFEKRKFLRVVVDREKVGGAFVGFLTSRVRCMEVNDPAHILWRICILAVQAAGLKGRFIKDFR